MEWIKLKVGWGNVASCYIWVMEIYSLEEAKKLNVILDLLISNGNMVTRSEIAKAFNHPNETEAHRLRNHFMDLLVDSGKTIYMESGYTVSVNENVRNFHKSGGFTKLYKKQKLKNSWIYEHYMKLFVIPAFMLGWWIVKEWIQPTDIETPTKTENTTTKTILLQDSIKQDNDSL